MGLQVAIALRQPCAAVALLEAGGGPVMMAETVPTSNPFPGVCHPGLIQVSGGTFPSDMFHVSWDGESHHSLLGLF